MDEHTPAALASPSGDPAATPSGWRLLEAAFLREWVSLRRYPFNLVSGVLTLLIVFFLLFYGVRLIPGAFQLGQTLSGLVVGFVSWVAMLAAFQGFSEEITRGALEGTLEQQALSPWGLDRVLLAGAVAGNVSNLAVTGIVLLAVMAIARQPLYVPVLDVALMLVLLMVQGAAFGLVMGGLALLYKRVEASFQIWQFLFIGLLIIPWDGSPWVRLIPFTWTHYVLQHVMRHGARVSDMAADVVGAAVVSLVYFLIAWALFRRMDRAARRLARLAHY
ncbi:ABC transporter permease [Carboxydochorda subterranea]|uniref:ABC transporter permease n=1 Tax=Carboxydichorda subterranea TaxID=3109565 RepID=A0ABZ1BV90_9FIRM|nr:ABC transporter permease [Limnochorda sp. L945t]WRP16568.1 ABC transporter permease [Limnochorda sp. L945t]